MEEDGCKIWRENSRVEDIGALNLGGDWCTTARRALGSPERRAVIIFCAKQPSQPGSVCTLFAKIGCTFEMMRTNRAQPVRSLSWSWSWSCSRSRRG
jgi:hypothetical protein